MSDALLDTMMAERRWKDAPTAETHAAYVDALATALKAAEDSRATLLRAVDLATEIDGVDSEHVRRIEAHAATLSDLINVARARLQLVERADPSSGREAGTG